MYLSSNIIPFENKKYSILHTIFTQYLKLEICTSILIMGIIKLVRRSKNKVYIKVQNNIYANIDEGLHNIIMKRAIIQMMSNIAIKIFGCRFYN